METPASFVQLLGVAGLLAAVVHEQPAAGGGPGDQKGEPIVLESFDDPYLPGAPGGGGAGGAGFPAPVVFGDFVSIQVNVGAGGLNVTGDAANEPSIAVDPTAPNRIAIGWRQFDSIASNFRQGGFSSSRTGGRSWAAKDVLEAQIFRSDPVLGAGPDGTFYYLSLEVTAAPFSEFFTDMFISTDGGATWPIQNFAFGGDKQWFAIDATGGIGDGHIYQAWNVAGNEFFPATFNRSVDSGLTWQNPLQYDPNEVAFPVFGLIDVGPDGAVYVAGALNSTNSGTFWVVRSSSLRDAAQIPSFEQITDIDLGGNLQIGAAPNPAGLAGQVNVAVDKSGGPNNGNVYVLCSVNPLGPDPMDVHLIRSTDSGVSFSAPVRVNDDLLTNAWQWFGQMSVAPNGRIDVVFNDTRNSGLANISELFYTFSTDGGLTWAPNMQASPSYDSHIGWPNQNKLGDYYHMVSDLVGADLAYAATFNGEQDVYYLRIGDYDCNGNGVGDPDDIAAMTSGDCNGNEIPDECEIAAGTLADDNANGIPDLCDCQADVNGDGSVNVLDLIDLLLCFGHFATPPCDTGQDINGDGTVNVADLIQLLLAFGMSCP